MKTTFTLLGAALGATLLSVAPSYAVTLYSDDFQSSLNVLGSAPDGWSASLGTIKTVNHLDGDVAGSNKFMWLDGLDTPGNPGVDTQAVQSTAFSTQGYSTITFNFDYAGTRTEGNDTLTFLGAYLLAADASGAFSAISTALPLGVGTSGDGGLDWTTFAITVSNITASFLKLEFQYRSTAGTEAAYVDNIFVTAVPLPAALPLGAAGLGALALLGWIEKRRRNGLAALA